VHAEKNGKRKGRKMTGEKVGLGKSGGYPGLAGRDDGNQNVADRGRGVAKEEILMRGERVTHWNWTSAVSGLRS
jgi:hypothetical protein